MKKIKDWKKFEDLKPIVEEFDYDYVKLEATKEAMMDIQAGIERVLEEHPEYICDIFFDDGLEYGELMRNPTIKVSIWDTHH